MRHMCHHSKLGGLGFRTMFLGAIVDRVAGAAVFGFFFPF